MRELGDDVTHSLTDTRTQPFIVKDVSVSFVLEDWEKVNMNLPASMDGWLPKGPGMKCSRNKMIVHLCGDMRQQCFSADILMFNTFKCTYFSNHYRKGTCHIYKYSSEKHFKWIPFYHHHCYSSSYNHSNVVEEFECVSLCIIFANSKMLYDSSRNDSNSRKHIQFTLQYYTVELTS
mgnify:CR=1 FL=1